MNGMFIRPGLVLSCLDFGEEAFESEELWCLASL